MIIFDLETLADDSHRRHFIDPSKNTNVEWWTNPEHASGDPHKGNWIKNGLPWKPDYQAFYEACDKDEPIDAVICMYKLTMVCSNIAIWSGRCELVKDKTIDWLHHHLDLDFYSDRCCPELKMRPIGDERQTHVIKKEWLEEELHKVRLNNFNPAIKANQVIQMVFSSDPQSITMYRSYGIFVFDCRQE